MKPPCPQCGFVHASNDARAVGRFTRSAAGYAADFGGAPVRTTRAEAEADMCTHRATSSRLCGRMDRQPSSKGTALSSTDSPVSATRVRILPEALQPQEPPSFPAAAMEVAAREGAWLRFLSEARLSLLVAEIDDSVRDGAGDVLAWLRRCCDDLSSLVGGCRS